MLVHCTCTHVYVYSVLFISLVLFDFFTVTFHFLNLCIHFYIVVWKREREGDVDSYTKRYERYVIMMIRLMEIGNEIWLFTISTILSSVTLFTSATFVYILSIGTGRTFAFASFENIVPLSTTPDDFTIHLTAVIVEFNKLYWLPFYSPKDTMIFLR